MVSYLDNFEMLPLRYLSQIPLKTMELLILSECKLVYKCLCGSKLRRVAFLSLAFNDLEAMIESLKKLSVNGLLLDRHVAVSNTKRFKDKTLEIGRIVDYDYYIGMSVRPPHNSTQICDVIKKCANDLASSEAFEMTALQVGTCCIK